jgi:L-rhamnose mutarotase
VLNIFEFELNPLDGGEDMGLEKYIKAHISSFINLRTESKPENVKHISIYPKNTKKNIYIFFLGGNNLI